MTDQFLIVLTYKNKLLLISKDIDVDDIKKNIWSFISGQKESSETYEIAALRQISEVTNLSLTEIEDIAETDTKPLYHGKLTDKHVNSIERAEGWRLDFLKLKEIASLILEDKTRETLQKNKDLIQHLLA